MKSINNRISELRAAMAQYNIQAVIIPTSDPHQSEYPADYWQQREWISGFTGSAGTVCVLENHAGLWTDSRYFLQGEQELQGTELVLHRMYNQFDPSYLTYIADQLKSGDTVVVNGKLVSASFAHTMQTMFDKKGINVRFDIDLLEGLWSERPSLSIEPIFIHEERFAGQSITSKLANIRTKMKDQAADLHVLTALDDIAWTFNLRGNDVPCNPVFMAFATIGKNDASLYIDSVKILPSVSFHLAQAGVNVKPYHEIYNDLKKIDAESKVIIDPTSTNHDIVASISGPLIETSSVPKLLKGIKNEVEINNTRNVMAKDGAAIAEALFWLENTLAKDGQTTEFILAQQLIAARSKRENYVTESFSAIIGYKDNGAVIHYHPSQDDCKTIYPDGILLIDNGGQYLDGTTDTTRTIILSAPTTDQQKHYTLILKGMIQLSRAIFPKGTTGAQLDTFARQFLWQNGLNYLHGTGHGVGCFLNVHEPPQSFAPVHSEKGRVVFEKGMITSNEPGYYIEGQYGMRIENLVVCIDAPYDGYLAFETLTYYPFDTNLIDKSLLTIEEISWINAYQRKSYDVISPLLSDGMISWFDQKCKTI